MKEGLISTICHDKDFHCSSKWLGKYSPVEEIKNSNMWIVKGMDKNQLSEEEFRRVITLCVKSNEERKEYGTV